MGLVCRVKSHFEQQQSSFLHELVRSYDQPNDITLADRPTHDDGEYREYTVYFITAS